MTTRRKPRRSYAHRHQDGADAFLLIAAAVLAALLVIPSIL